ncbi:MAG: hypothetical protein R2751_11325 [Bacteroidales bacterium]
MKFRIRHTRLSLAALCLFLSAAPLLAQEEAPASGISLSGFVKTDFFYDSRQTVTAREGHFLLYPADVLSDAQGNDINAKDNFNILSIQSRLTGKITGPDAFGAKTSGVIEGAFFGTVNSDINGFRLRHAYVKLNWTNTELLLGQYWHMKFVTGCFPGTVSFNTGVPFQYFSRNPQVRLTQSFGNLSLGLMAAAQRDFASPGGSQVLRNAILPDVNAQIAYATDRVLIGATAGYKTLVPRLVTDSLYRTTTGIGGFSAQAFLKLAPEAFTFKAQVTYLQNGYDGLSLGGFAIRSVTDPARDDRDYTNLNTLNVWTELHSNGSKVQVGVFAGYAKNLGASEALDDPGTIATYARGANIASLFRISPRVVLNSGKVRFALELETTGAAYGRTVDSMGIPGDLHTVVNQRVLFASYYFF